MGTKSIKINPVKKIQEISAYAEQINSIIVLRNGKLLVCGNSNFIYIYETYNNKFEYRGRILGLSKINSLYESKADNFIYSANDEPIITKYNINTLQLITKIETNHFSKINKVIETSDEKIITCSKDRTIKVFSIFGMSLQTLSSHKDEVKSILELPNNILVSGSYDYTLRFWDLKKLKNIEKYNIQNVDCNLWNSMFFLKDKNLLFVGGAKIVAVINIKYYRLEKVFKRQIGFVNAINGLINENIIVGTAGNSPNSLIIFSSNMKRQKTIEYHSDVGIRSIVTFDKDKFITGDYLGKITIWTY